MQTETVIEVDGLKLRGQLYLPQSNPRLMVCICHGIPADLPNPSDEGYAPLARRLLSEGFAAFTFNFRGTGASEGNLDIMGWTRDLKGVVDYLTSLRATFSRLVLLGFSAGGAVSIHVASQDQRVGAVAACASPAEFFPTEKFKDLDALLEHFRRIGAIRDEDFPPSKEEWLKGFEEIRPIKYIAGISPRPLLLVHGTEDEVVDISHVHRLYAEAGEPKKLAIIEGAGHRLKGEEKAIEAIVSWLKSLKA